MFYVYRTLLLVFFQIKSRALCRHHHRLTASYQGIHLLIHHLLSCKFVYYIFFILHVALQNRIAKLFDKEAALFVPTGTMGNLISGQYQM